MSKEALDLEAMDKELKAAIQEDGTEQVQDQVPEYTEEEQRAMEMGWNPDPDSLEGSDKEWVPADEFIRNQKWVNEIKSLKRQVRKTEKLAEAFKEHNKIVQQKAYEQAIKDLRKQKTAAAEDRDVVRMLEIDEEIDKVLTEQKTEAAKQQSEYTKNDWDEAFENFVDENQWYSDNLKMRAVADKAGWEYAQSHPGASPDDVYSHVLKVVKEEFKEDKPQKQPQAQRVAAPQRRGTAAAKGKHTINDIPEEHRHIAMTIIRGGMKEEDYLKQYFPEDYS